ncbi:CGNR zinc finger domain-containing protein [Streptomyces varsoviensis]|uniref:Zinc finger CGNR domain-containing protein n=1 Tax=Streptomyces varsoviensis TaxID=67373 RepID=A0ABR5IUY8_9ACTN|nr:CGNR zinc finger domain-containing protein [Streptomyces varsoviensis]KOG79026.1 hypothetical protein ADK38_39265 [Streptomyces varsoviensis]
MLINHDTRCALDAVVRLLNTEGPGDDDGLATPADLRRYATSCGFRDPGPLGAADVAAVRSVRERFARVFAAPDTASAAALLNAMVAEAGTTPRLSDHDGYDWHVHYFAPGASLADHLAADGGMALAFLVVAGERERLRRCEAPGCGRAFVDVSRNRSRRYCSSRTCGNRLHVAAYRARRRETAG